MSTPYFVPDEREQREAARNRKPAPVETEPTSEIRYSSYAAQWRRAAQAAEKRLIEMRAEAKRKETNDRNTRSASDTRSA